MTELGSSYPDILESPRMIFKNTSVVVLVGRLEDVPWVFGSLPIYRPLWTGSLYFAKCHDRCFKGTVFNPSKILLQKRANRLREIKELPEMVSDKH